MDTGVSVMLDLDSEMTKFLGDIAVKFSPSSILKFSGVLLNNILVRTSLAHTISPILFGVEICYFLIFRKPFALCCFARAFVVELKLLRYMCGITIPCRHINGTVLETR